MEYAFLLIFLSARMLLLLPFLEGELDGLG